jgi:hypothetical protein
MFAAINPLNLTRLSWSSGCSKYPREDWKEYESMAQHSGVVNGERRVTDGYMEKAVLYQRAHLRSDNRQRLKYILAFEEQLSEQPSLGASCHHTKLNPG